jgi:hypothetical protein
MGVTRYPYGVSNADQNGGLSEMGQLDPTLFHTFFDDFDGLVVQDGSTSAVVQWTFTLNAGTIAMTPVDDGAVLITTANTDEAITQMQRTSATFLPTANKKIFFKARLKVANAALTDIFVGLAAIDTALIAASAIDVTDAMGFFKAATATSLTFYNRKDASAGSTSASSIGTVANNTYFTVGFYFDGVATVQYFFNDALVGSVSGSSTYLPDAQLSPSIAIGQEGTAGADTATIDYIFVAAER